MFDKLKQQMSRFGRCLAAVCSGPALWSPWGRGTVSTSVSRHGARLLWALFRYGQLCASGLDGFETKSGIELLFLPNNFCNLWDTIREVGT